MAHPATQIVLESLQKNHPLLQNVDFKPALQIPLSNTTSDLEAFDGGNYVRVRNILLKHAAVVRKNHLDKLFQEMQNTANAEGRDQVKLAKIGWELFFTAQNVSERRRVHDVADWFLEADENLYWAIIYAYEADIVKLAEKAQTITGLIELRGKLTTQGKLAGFIARKIVRLIGE